MKDLSLGTRGLVSTMPTYNGLTTVVTVLLHVVVLIALIQVKTHPVRVSSAGVMQTGIGAYVAGPIGTAGAAAPKPAAEPKKSTIPRASEAAPEGGQSDAAQSAGAAGMPGGQPGGGPVRLGSGGSLTLLNKVTPVYPSLMQSARVNGQVVLDAIIHSDGTIGDITVLRSTNEAFAQAAIAAVKRWRYSPISYEGIVTVTVNFTLH